MKKVLFIGPCAFKYKVVGGAVAKNRILYYYLKSKGVNIRLVDTYWEKTGIISYIKGKVNKGVNLLRMLLFVKKSDYIIVGSQSMESVIKVLDKKKSLYKTYVVGIGGMVDYSIKVSKVSKEMWNKVKGILVESEEMVKNIERDGVNSAKYVSNFKMIPKLDIKFYEEEKEVLTLFYLGQIRKEKGIDTLLDAMETYNKKYGKRFELFLYGSYEGDNGELAQRVQEIDNVYYKGVVDLIDAMDGYMELLKYDIFVFPSRWKGESLSSAVIDALALGKPVVASRHNLIEYLVKDNYNGLLFEKSNSSDLMRALDYIYENQAQISVMGRRSLETAKDYDVSTVLSFFEV